MITTAGKRAATVSSMNSNRWRIRIIRAAFNQRRKTLANAVSHGSITCENGATAGRERVTEVLREMGLSETIRGEAMTLPQFAEFSDRL